MWAALGYNPLTKEFTKVPAIVIVVLDLPAKVEEKWLPELRLWFNIEDDQLEKKGKPYYSQISFPNGSILRFMFHEQGYLAFESIEVDFLLFDEPPPRAIYIALLRGTSRKGHKQKILFVGTPISSAWMRTEIYEPWSQGLLPDTECFTYGTEVNRSNLAEGYIERFTASLSEKEREIRLRGMFFDLEGLALAHLFKREAHVIPNYEWPKEYPVVIAIDPHPSKAHHALMLGIDPENDYVVLKTLRAKQVARDFAKSLIDWAAGFRVVDLVSDSLGSSEGTGGEGFKSFIQVLNDEFKAHGSTLRVRSTSWKEKSDEDFIERIRDVLLIPTEPNNYGQCIPQLRIIEGNNGLIHDVQNVQWVKWRDIDEYKPKLDITNKDFLSCLKYALATNPSFSRYSTTKFSHTRPITSYGQKPRSAGYYRRKLGVS